MNSEASAFSECPQYDEKSVDAMIEKYCTESAIASHEKATRKQKGIDVSKRVSAIHKTLSQTGGPIFGTVELHIAIKK